MKLISGIYMIKIVDGLLFSLIPNQPQNDEISVFFVLDKTL